MANKVTITVGGTNYNIITDDSPEYMKECAEYFDAQFTDISRSAPQIPTLSVAVLAGITVTDEFFKTRESVDNLVMQMKEYMAETTRMRSEVGELRRELDRAKAELERYRNRG